MSQLRTLLLANDSKPEVADVLARLREELKSFISITEERAADEPLPDSSEGIDLVIAVGGDGTLIGQARRIVDRGWPLLGINTGRLGFLAEFDCDELIGNAATILGERLPIHEHLMLSLSIEDGEAATVEKTVAMNDAVITAGEPFRMIELSLTINGAEGPQLNGDGMIVATPVGSTAYNVSAGGPIVHPQLEALTITPLAAHSLAFRPIVLSGGAEIRATVRRGNPGTSLVVDGQVAASLTEGQSVIIRRHERKVRLVVNPATTYWRILLDKLHWAAPPTYRRQDG